MNPRQKQLSLNRSASKCNPLSILLGQRVLLAAALFSLCHSFAAAPVITDIVMIGANPRLGIQGDVGSTHQIRYSTDLSQTNWTVLTNVVVAASPYWLVDVAAPPAPFRFYRVLALNLAPTNIALIPAGSFTMGDTFSEGNTNELPSHTVYVSAFFMDKSEVTKALWDDVYQWAITHSYSFDNPGSGKAADHPVQTISWYDMVKWCNARSEKDGRVTAYYTSVEQTTVYRTGQVDVQNDWVKWNAGYRLPTEAEWEKAARGGGSGRRFPWSDADTITHSRANYISDVAYAYDISLTRGYHPTFNDGVFPYTNPVGYFAANGYGLYGMAGNVFEYCWDVYGPYSGGSQTDPRGATSGPGHVLRGGSWFGPAVFNRVARRAFNPPTTAHDHGGFRSVLPLG
jgi:formylglycine-generating enzyme required for sulfatase activity